MKLLKCLMIDNRWYSSGKKIPMSGIVVHSSGANNSKIKRYVQPIRGQKEGLGEILPERRGLNQYEILKAIGTNAFNNHWNRLDQPYGMHAFVGQLADGTVGAVQTLPWDAFLWGCGSGQHGSYNSSHIQFEICEDTTDGAYTRAAYHTAAELCAYLCREFSIPVSRIVSHNEAGRAGHGSNHADPEHWWSRYGLTMDGFRAEVARLLGQEGETEVRYHKLEDMPPWAKETVKKLVEKKLLHGNEAGDLDLGMDMVRLLVILDRMVQEKEGKHGQGTEPVG